MRETFSITLTVEYKINFLYWITFEYWHLQGEGVNLNYMLKLFQLIIFYFKATAIDKSNSIYSTKHVFFINILRVMHKPMYIYKWSDYGQCLPFYIINEVGHLTTSVDHLAEFCQNYHLAAICTQLMVKFFLQLRFIEYFDCKCMKIPDFSRIDSHFVA